MALNIQQTDTAGVTAQACNARTVTGATSRAASVGGTAGSTAVSTGNQNNGTHLTKIAFSWTPDSDTTWGSGTWVVRLNITTGNTNLTIEDLCIRRLNSSNVDQASIGALTAQATSASAGTKTWNITGSSQTPGAGDKVLITLTVSNASGQMNQAFSWTPSLIIDTPFTAATPSDLKIRRRVNGVDTDTIKTLTTTDAYYNDGIWTATRTHLGSAEIGGVRVNGTVDNIQIEDIWLQTAYTPAQTIVLTANSGSYTLTGQTASLEYNRIFAANSGSYSITGQAATLFKSIILQALSGSYTLSGQNASLLATRQLIANSGSYVITGQAATIFKSIILAANSGSYSVTGQPVTLQLLKKLVANPGSYNLTGQDVSFIKAFIFSVESGQYVLTGQEANLTSDHVELAAGIYIPIFKRRRR